MSLSTNPIYNPELRAELSGEMRDAMFPPPEFQSSNSSAYSVDDGVNAILSASSFGAHVEANGVPIEKWLDDPANIEKYCLDRLGEVKRLNVLSRTPSAFSCIFSFMGFLSQFANSDGDETEAACFRNLTVKYMRQLRCRFVDKAVEAGTVINARSWVSGKGLGEQVEFNTWGEVLYSLGRCGLVHSLSTIGNRDLNQNQIDLRLTHSYLPDAVPVDLFEMGNDDTEKSKRVISTTSEAKEIVSNYGCRELILKGVINDEETNDDGCCRDGCGMERLGGRADYN